jgi:hypothetical protein
MLPQVSNMFAGDFCKQGTEILFRFQGYSNTILEIPKVLAQV